MEWREVKIKTTEEGAELLYATLCELGISSVSIEESSDAVQRQLAQEGLLWDYVELPVLEQQTGLVVYLPENEETRGLLDAIMARLNELKADSFGLDMGELSMQERVVHDSEWENRWKEFYKPFPVGERLLVRPKWEPQQSGERLEIVIDPSAAFGTGSHATTRMCMELLEKAQAGGKRVLDVGCGSGILSIAALLLGAESLVAVDIDPIATKTARENLAENGFSEAPVFCGNVLSDGVFEQKIAGEYDLILSNIVADAVMALCPFVRKNLASGGAWISSGIIADREAELKAAMCKAGFEIAEAMADGEWRAFLARVRE